MNLNFETMFAVGGLLNATFGNATELIISIYALRTGRIRVVQLSLLGSLLSNLLFVLGIAFFSGGMVRNEQVFNKVGNIPLHYSMWILFVLFDFNMFLPIPKQATAVVDSGLLLMAVMGLLFPASLHSTGTEVHLGVSELALSRVSSCVLLLAYVASILFQLKNIKHLVIIHHSSFPFFSRF